MRCCFVTSTRGRAKTSAAAGLSFLIPSAIATERPRSNEIPIFARLQAPACARRGLPAECCYSLLPRWKPNPSGTCAFPRSQEMLLCPLGFSTLVTARYVPSWQPLRTSIWFLPFASPPADRRPIGRPDDFRELRRARWQVRRERAAQDLVRGAYLEWLCVESKNEIR